MIKIQVETAARIQRRVALDFPPLLERGKFPQARDELVNSSLIPLAENEGDTWSSGCRLMSESRDLSVGHTSGDPSPRTPSRELVPVVVPRRAKIAPEPQAPPSSDRLSSSRFALAAAAAVAVVVAVAGALVWEDRQQSGILAEHARETESLAQTIKSLRVRLDAIDAARSHDELSDLRRSVGDMKSAVVSSREFNSALAQLSQRVDKLDNDQSAKVNKLSERVDHEDSTLTAELSGRVDKLEKKIVPPISVPSQVAQAEQSPVPPKLTGNVSMETTGSIERPRPLLRGYIVLDARSDVALIGGRFGEQEVRRGDFLPGAGRVERIEFRGGRWTVLTSEGLIAAADFPPY
jgi:hypothetical protein